MSEWEAIIGSNSRRAASYGSCVISLEKSTIQYVRHYLDQSDTLPGLALKYNSTTDELRRINKLYNTDSIFVRSYLLVPAPQVCSASCIENGEVNEHLNYLPAKSSFKTEDDVSSFLKQLDSKINAGKQAVKDFTLKDNALKTRALKHKV